MGLPPPPTAERGWFPFQSVDSSSREVDAMTGAELKKNDFRSMRRTKLVCTIGPATCGFKQLETLAVQVEYEKSRKLPDPSSADNVEFRIVLTLIRDGLKTEHKKYNTGFRSTLSIAPSAPSRFPLFFATSETHDLIHGFPASLLLTSCRRPTPSTSLIESAAKQRQRLAFSDVTVAVGFALPSISLARQIYFNHRLDLPINPICSCDKAA